MRRILSIALAATLLCLNAGAQSRSKGPAWLHDAVFYEIYPCTFMDTDGNGIGDLEGIISRLDYVKSLGANAIWLNPTFVSAWQDGGYDIIDFYETDPRFGTNEDMVRLFEEAHKRGLKVCLDLVAGHSSIDCQWFKESAAGGKDGHYADYYIWTDELPADELKKFQEGKSQFVQIDAPRGKYYMKNYYDIQPALNYGYAKKDPACPWQQDIHAPGPEAVKREMRNIMMFWMDKGADGFRVDMASSLVKNDSKDKAVTMTVWQEMRSWMDEAYPENVLISEWSNPLSSIPAGFHIDFILPWSNTKAALLYHPDGIRYSHQDCWFDLAGKGSTAPFLKMFQQYYDKTRDLGYFAIPTSNHDLPRMNLRDRNTPEQLKTMMTFFLTMPGVPYIYYGDEIGIRYIEGLPSKEGSLTHRSGSRTPMQWAEGPCAGFSTCQPEELYFPVHTENGALTVEAQESDPESLLNFTRNLIALRKASAALGNDGEWKLLSDPEVPYPLVYERSSGSERCIIALNPCGATVVTDLVPKDSETLVSVGKLVRKKSGLRMVGPSAVVVRAN